MRKITPILLLILTALILGGCTFNDINSALSDYGKRTGESVKQVAANVSDSTSNITHNVADGAVDVAHNAADGAQNLAYKMFTNLGMFANRHFGKAALIIFIVSLAVFLITKKTAAIKIRHAALWIGMVVIPVLLLLTRLILGIISSSLAQ